MIDYTSALSPAISLDLAFVGVKRARVRSTGRQEYRSRQENPECARQTTSYFGDRTLAYLSQAFSQLTGPGRLWVSLGTSLLLVPGAEATSQSFTKRKPTHHTKQLTLPPVFLPRRSPLPLTPELLYSSPSCSPFYLCDASV